MAENSIKSMKEIVEEGKRSREASEDPAHLTEVCEHTPRTLCASVAGKPLTNQPMRSHGGNIRPQAEMNQSFIDPDVLAREELLGQQFIIDAAEGMKSAVSGLMAKEIIAKANLVLESAGQVEDKYLVGLPQGAKFTMAKILLNGGVVIEINTDEAADWLKDKEHQRFFEHVFGGLVIAKSWAYNLVAEFLPTYMKDTLKDELCTIEKDSDLLEGTLTGVKWMRNPSN